MLLAHGTRSAYLQRILEEGLRSARLTGIRPNFKWSDPNLVYLEVVPDNGYPEWGDCVFFIDTDWFAEHKQQFRAYAKETNSAYWRFVRQHGLKVWEADGNEDVAANQVASLKPIPVEALTRLSLDTLLNSLSDTPGQYKNIQKLRISEIKKRIPPHMTAAARIADYTFRVFKHREN